MGQEFIKINYSGLKDEKHGYIFDSPELGIMVFLDFERLKILIKLRTTLIAIETDINVRRGRYYQAFFDNNQTEWSFILKDRITGRIISEPLVGIPNSTVLNVMATKALRNYGAQ